MPDKITTAPMIHTHRHTTVRSRSNAFAVGVALVVLGAACTTNVEVQTEETVSRTPPSTAAPAPTATAPPQVPTPPPEPTPTPRTPGVLTVNDTDAVGVVGDSLLSLVEAVKLANGLLTQAQLSADETAQVSGDPGSEVADTINVNVGLGVEILLPGADAWIIELFGNDGDTINGGGAVLTGGVQGSGISHNAILVGSADVTISQFSFTDLTAGVGIESASRQLSGIKIEANAFNDISVRDITMQNSVDGGVLSNLEISNNTFDASERRSDVHTFITVRGASGIDGQTTQNTSIEGLVISANSFTAGLDTTAACIAVSGGFVPFGVESEVVGGAVEDLFIADNTISGCDTAIALAGAVLNQTSGVGSANTVSNVELSGNTIIVSKVGLELRGAFVQPVPQSFQFTTPIDARLSANTVTDVDLATNVWSALGVLVRMVGAEFEVPGTGSAQNNSIGPVVAAQIIADDFDQFCEEATNVGELVANGALATSCADLEPS